MLYTVADEDEYSIYNHNRSIYYGNFIWKYNYEGNSIRNKNTILDYGIITEIYGIGRFAIILFGTLFSVASCLVSFDKKGK